MLQIPQLGGLTSTRDPCCDSIHKHLRLLRIRPPTHDAMSIWIQSRSSTMTTDAGATDKEDDFVDSVD